METKKLGSEPAFPVDGQNAYSALHQNYAGMSKRFYAACAAMQGILSGMDCDQMVGHRVTDTKGIIELAYMCADELLKQENE